jgi:alpha-L-fucosidase
LYAELGEGKEGGADWVPAECDVSIRPGWFYRPEEDNKVKSVKDLLSLYHASVGRGGSFLLNVPPNRRGLISDVDAKTLIELKKSLASIYKHDLAINASEISSDVSRGKGYDARKVIDGDDATFWGAPDGEMHGSIIMEFKKPIEFDRVMLQEPIQLGQRVKSFVVKIPTTNGWEAVARGTTVGYKRIITFPAVKSAGVMVSITDARACPALSRIGLFDSATHE